jgi:hypothetical protein
MLDILIEVKNKFGINDDIIMNDLATFLEKEGLVDRFFDFLDQKYPKCQSEKICLWDQGK